jgi:hypothetical protein
MSISRAEIASNTSEIENWVYDLLKKLQTSSNNKFEVIGNDEYREVKNVDFNIFYTEGIITIKDDAISIDSDGAYEINGEKNQYVSHMFPIFFDNLKKLLLDYKDMSASNSGFVEAK